MEKESVYRLVLGVGLLGAAVFGFREVLQYEQGDVGGVSSGPTGTLTGKVQIAGTNEFIRDPAGASCKNSQEAAEFIVRYEGPASGTAKPDKCGPNGPQYSISSLPLGIYKLSITAPAGWRLHSAPDTVQVFADFEAIPEHFLVSRLRGVPDAPKGLQAKCADTASEVILSWDKVGGADSYNLRVDRVSNNSAALEGGWFASTPPDLKVDQVQSPYTFSIAYGQRYRFWVHSVSSGGAGVQAESVSFICRPAGTGPLVTVVSPNGREGWTTGSTRTISWLQENVDTVSIGYKICDSCLGWIAQDLAVDESAPEGSYSWTIPSTFPIGVNYQIYIVAHKTGIGQASDISDTTFSIAAPRR